MASECFERSGSSTGGERMMTEDGLIVHDFLAHHGVKGMHWGVRKARTGKESKVIAKRKKALGKRRTLSDEEIKKHIDRLSSEKKLKDLIKEDVAPGKSMVQRVLSQSGEKVAKTVAAGAGLLAIKVALDRKFKPKEERGFKNLLKDASSYLTPKPKK